MWYPILDGRKKFWYNINMVSLWGSTYLGLEGILFIQFETSYYKWYKNRSLPWCGGLFDFIRDVVYLVS